MTKITEIAVFLSFKGERCHRAGVVDMQCTDCPVPPSRSPHPRECPSRSENPSLWMDRHCDESVRCLSQTHGWSAAASSIAVCSESFVYRIMSLVSSMLWNVCLCPCHEVFYALIFKFNYDKYSLRSGFPRRFVLMTSCIGLHCLPNGGKMGAVTSDLYPALGTLTWPKSSDMTLYLSWSRTDACCDDASPLCEAKVPL